jgi:HEAT repeat protein
VLRDWTQRLRSAVRRPINLGSIGSLVSEAQSTDPGRRAEAARELGALKSQRVLSLLPRMLEDEVPGVRRAAAWASGWLGETSLCSVLEAAVQEEPCDAPRLSMGIAAVRCGSDVAKVWAILESAAERELWTVNGLRRPAPQVGAGVSNIALLWRAALYPVSDTAAVNAAEDPCALRSARHGCVLEAPDDRQALLDLAVLGHPHDLELILAAMRSQGRRMRHTAATCIGLNGHPAGGRALKRVLHAVDVDPGHGFTGRLTAAQALGRLGMPSAGRALEQAMRNEALDHEGRPGAGLGIQRPVRTSMLAALGEIGAAGRVTLVASYLSNRSGSPQGGLYLQAMDALVKLDGAAAARALLCMEPNVAAHALSVLGALGDDEGVEDHRNDPREQVRRIALALLDAG